MHRENIHLESAISKVLRIQASQAVEGKKKTKRSKTQVYGKEKIERSGKGDISADVMDKKK